MPTTIVIADDHAVFRSALKAFLEQESDLLVVGEAGTGREALAAIDADDPDVLLLDISMPGLSWCSNRSRSVAAEAGPGHRRFDHA